MIFVSDAPPIVQRNAILEATMIMAMTNPLHTMELANSISCAPKLRLTADHNVSFRLITFWHDERTSHPVTAAVAMALQRTVNMDTCMRRYTADAKDNLRRHISITSWSRMRNRS